MRIHDTGHISSQQIKHFIFRLYRGLFSSPDVQCASTCRPPTSAEVFTYGSLLKTGDLLADSVTVKGTTYKVDHILVTTVRCKDALEVGVVLKVVLRAAGVFFFVTLYEATRNRFSFFRNVDNLLF